ncbi:MAG: HAMP domain-containing protein [Calditrichaeota bacterium]|nr:HAMP domain-containing protein [Calditrichota bacterium]
MRTRFTAQLALLFLVLILGLGFSLSVLTIKAMRMFNDETEQKLNRTLAHEMAMEFAPFLGDRIDVERIEERIAYLTGINRRIEIYLLSSTGMIKASFVSDNQRLERSTVDLAPLKAFERGDAVPILGEDPLSAQRLKPFSATEIEIMGEKHCWLYVILGGQEVENVAGMLSTSYIAKTTLRGLLLILLVTGVVGLLLFTLLTRRLRVLSEVMGDFHQGRLDRRVPAPALDEVGQLGSRFNDMADTIVSNMDELRKTDRLRRELIANVSHDLRSPMASIQGYLETLVMKNDTLGPEDRGRYLDISLQNTRSLGSLVNQLFELSKLDARQVEPEMERFSIAELLQDLVMQYDARAKEAGLILELDRPTALSPVLGDIALVERVLTNLLDNALRYTPAGGRVSIIPADTLQGVRIEVRDTGAGISAEDLPRIFERFFRVEKSRGRGRGGAGLGLAICKKIVELHGGLLEVRSTLEQGTTFAFILPHARQLGQ